MNKTLFRVLFAGGAVAILALLAPVIWAALSAGMAAIAALNASSGEDLINQMLADEASSAVLDNYNKVFAELELEATSITETKQLSFDSGMVLDMSNINLAQKV